jgi:hypothetical protein
MSVGELAQPLTEYLELNYPSLSDDARVAFAVQIVLASRRSESVPIELDHFAGGRSPN